MSKTFEVEGQYFTNPILPGFYPDPSICRVEEDYYLVTSTFVYFPGIPVFHSKDLVHWEQIAHVLDRPSQLDLDDLGHSRGIFAPTIRYYNGIFYVITTNVDKGDNFIVTATNPAGPWSEPAWLANAPGIDPSLFFDIDGKAYYVGTRPVSEGPKYFGNWEVWLQEIDLKKMSLTGEVFSLWRGALRDAIWPEGPHLYYKDNWYYLMISEGGTDYHHAITIARSKAITGPYKGNPGNPILTHRHLGRKYPIQNVGHGDLVETPNGEWWMVALGSRPYGGYFRNLGRETFLVPVIWEDGWPVVSPGNGRLELTYPKPSLPACSVQVLPGRDDFNTDKLLLNWIFLRTPRDRFWSLKDRPGYLRLKLRPEMMTEEKNPSFVGRRQQHIHFIAKTVMEFKPLTENETAGMVLIQNNQYQYRMECTLRNEKKIIRLIKCCAGIAEEIAVQPIKAGNIYMKIVGRGQAYSFYFGLSETIDQILAEKMDGRILSTDLAGGFVGTCLGIFASSNGEVSTNYSDFDWFEYQADEPQSNKLFASKEESS